MTETTPISVTVSPDDYRMVDGVYVFDWAREPEVWEKSYKSFAFHINKGRNPVILVGMPLAGKSTWVKQQRLVRGNVYFDATSINEERRRPLLEIAKAGGYVSAVFINTPFDICLERNKQRVDRPLPDEVMERMRGRLTRPTHSEGFLWVTEVSGPCLDDRLTGED